jgi:hypothetical protein
MGGRAGCLTRSADTTRAASEWRGKGEQSAAAFGQGDFSWLDQLQIAAQMPLQRHWGGTVKAQERNRR